MTKRLSIKKLILNQLTQKAVSKMKDDFGSKLISVLKLHFMQPTQQWILCSVQYQIRIYSSSNDTSQMMTAETFFQVKLKFSEHGMGLKLSSWPMFNHLIPGYYAIWNKTWTESDVVVTQAVRSGTHSKFSRVIENFPGPGLISDCQLFLNVPFSQVWESESGRGKHVSLLLNIKHLFTAI